MVDGWDEYVFVSGVSCETFCNACGQLRLWANPEQPTACGGCGSARIVVGPLMGEQLPKLRETWIIQRMKFYPCRALLEPDSEIAEPMTCDEPERYRAKGNGPQYAHLCEEHWQALPEDERALYARVDLAASAREVQLRGDVLTHRPDLLVFLDSSRATVTLVGVRDAETGEPLEVKPGDPPTVVDSRAAGAEFTASFVGTVKS